MKRGTIGIAAIWVGTILTMIVWKYLLVFRIPMLVERYSEEGKRLPALIRFVVDLLGRGIGANLLLLGAVAGTIVLFFRRHELDDEQYRRRTLIVWAAFFVPVAVVTLILVAPGLG
jgi:hypothetical protein